MVQDDAKYDEEACESGTESASGWHSFSAQSTIELAIWPQAGKISGFSGASCHAGMIHIALLCVLMIFIPSMAGLKPVPPEMAKSDPFLTRQVENDLVWRKCLQHFSL
jgi:hypothetical protein